MEKSKDTSEFEWIEQAEKDFRNCLNESNAKNKIAIDGRDEKEAQLVVHTFADYKVLRNNNYLNLFKRKY